MEYAIEISLPDYSNNAHRDGQVLKILQEFATNKKSGYERESAAICYNSLASILGAPVAPILLGSLSTLFDLYMDKGDVVRIAAAGAVKTTLKLFPPESTRIVFRTLESILENGKWRSKVGVLESFKLFVASARDYVAAELGNVLPKVEAAMHDTKQEVSSAAVRCATNLCATLANPDLAPHIPALVKCMANPDQVPACIKAMSNTTFVAEVKAPALAVLVPLLLRALNDRSMEVQRRTVVVIDNLVKLVRDPAVAATYLSPLVEGVQKIATGAAFPEVFSNLHVIFLSSLYILQVRAFGDAALMTLLKSGASSSGPPPSHRSIDEETFEVVLTLKTLLPDELTLTSPAGPKTSKTPQYTLLTTSLNFQAALVADLVHDRKFDDIQTWDRCIGVYMTAWLDERRGTAFAESVRKHYLAIDRVRVFDFFFTPVF